MKTCILRCYCGQTADYQNSMIGGYNVGHVVKTTGWRCLFQNSGGIIWLCPTCARLAGSVADTLIRVIGTGHVQLNHVVKLID